MPCKGCGDDCRCTAEKCGDNCKCDAGCNCAGKNKGGCKGGHCGKAGEKTPAK